MIFQVMVIKGFQVVYFREGDQWIGQALEFDLNSQGRNIDEAEIRLMLTVLVTAYNDIKAKRLPLTSLRKAPKKFWEMFEHARALAYMPPKIPAKKIPANIHLPARIEQRIAS